MVPCTDYTQTHAHVHIERERERETETERDSVVAQVHLRNQHLPPRSPDADAWACRDAETRAEL